MCIPFDQKFFKFLNPVQDGALCLYKNFTIIHFMYFRPLKCLLFQKLDFSEDITSICLPKVSRPSADFMNKWAATAQGWGSGAIDLGSVILTIRGAYKEIN